MPFAFAALRSAMAFLPQASKAVSDMSMRAGAEPLMTLKATELPGSSSSRRAPLRRLRGGTWKNTNMSVLKITDPSVPGKRKQRKSLPAPFGVLELALRPVAHHLQQRVALDDHGGGQVPVAAREVVIERSHASWRDC